MRTTVFIEVAASEKLKAVAMKKQISVSKLIIQLLTQLLNKKQGRKNFKFSAVKYQPSDKSKVFCRLHITMLEPVYERFIDGRKIHKSSVSNLLAQAIALYLDDDILLDSYPPTFYSFTENYQKYTSTFTIRWGLP